MFQLVVFLVVDYVGTHYGTLARPRKSFGPFPAWIAFLGTEIYGKDRLRPLPYVFRGGIRETSTSGATDVSSPVDSSYLIYYSTLFSVKREVVSSRGWSFKKRPSPILWITTDSGAHHGSRDSPLPPLCICIDPLTRLGVHRRRGRWKWLGKMLRSSYSKVWTRDTSITTYGFDPPRGSPPRRIKMGQD